MKIKFTLDREDIKAAIAAHVTQLTGISCNACNVTWGTYSYETPYVEIDTDAEQELTSLEAEQEVARLVA